VTSAVERREDPGRERRRRAGDELVGAEALLDGAGHDARSGSAGDAKLRTTALAERESTDRGLLYLLHWEEHFAELGSRCEKADPRPFVAKAASTATIGAPRSWHARCGRGDGG